MNKIINSDCLIGLNNLEDNSIDLLWTDPPYNINYADWDKIGDSKVFYTWTKNWLSICLLKMKDNASGYICIDWRYSYVIHQVLADLKLNILNRITWKRDKGRGASKNWKNIHEDIFFFSKSKNYIFNLENVMVKKEVIAPYRDETGNPKDWFEENGKKYRMTHPGNLWTEFVVPFWSCKEVKEYAKTKKTPNNTFEKHPTQKPLDLVKKCIITSSNLNDIVLDPFIGSGTTAIACIETNRQYIGFEQEKEYFDIANHRINLRN